MKILLSAFACDPDQGSEPGVGWAWAQQLARSGHEVCVFTKDHSRKPVEAALERSDLPNLEFRFLHIPNGLHKIPGLGIYPYYFAWQLKAYFAARTWMRSRKFDCLHHITYGSYRTPFFMAFLPLPSIFGPVGGAETTPVALMRGLSLGGKLREQARWLINYLTMVNPVTLLIWRRAALILLTTETTMKIVPRRYRWKCKTLQAITTPDDLGDTAVSASKQPGCCRALFVGRLLEWKGLHLVVKALAIARETSNVSLSIRGDGSQKGPIHKLVQAENLNSIVKWIPRFSARNEVLDIYCEHDVLVFPSFHDSGGMVVLEALSYGIPVICLDLGGPGELVNFRCGASIPTAGRSEQEIINAIAEQLTRFADMPEAEYQTLREESKRRSSEFEADKVVGKAYAWFGEMQPRATLLPGTSL